jgi:ABC-type polysaccharide/polyol phosphate transport system ATPase subunit
MDSDIAIRAEGLGKKYLIGHQRAEREGTLRDAIARGAGQFVRMGRALMRGQPLVAGDEVEDFWALRDCSFELRRGEVLGVVGRNGAGKSTLLKVLSRITEPTTGRVQINGRVASLLEVGTGFHPELSGRENIFLNGAILGMTRGEIRRKFDEIVAFSEVEKFLDTPVKRYSSGMYVRLAFAVAAHLEPEILIVDEVLAVGDAEFQKKCLGKMQRVAGEGRTVLFVSHNMAAIRRLCTRGLFMTQGQCEGTADLASTVQTYLATGTAGPGGRAQVLARDCELQVEHDGAGLVRVWGRSPFARRAHFTLGAVLSTLAGDEVFETSSADHPHSGKPGTEDFAFELQLPLQDIRPGHYVLQVFAFLHNEAWLIDKTEGPRIGFEAVGAAEAHEIYTGRPPGYGPLIAWRPATTSPP